MSPSLRRFIAEEQCRNTLMRFGTSVICVAALLPACTLEHFTFQNLRSIVVSSSNPSIPVGSTQQFTAIGRFFDGSSQDMTGSVSWTSSNTTVAVMNASGLATGLTAG